MSLDYETTRSFAFVFMQAALVLAALLVLFVIIANRYLVLRDSRSARSREVFKRSITEVVFYGDMSALVTAKRQREFHDLARVWISFCRSVADSAHYKLIAFARDAGLDSYVRRHIKDKRDWVRGNVCEVIGFMRLPGYTHDLLGMMASTNTILSVKAAFALARTDGRYARYLIAEAMLSREDWSIPLMSDLVRLLRDDSFCEVMMSSVNGCSERMSRAIRISSYFDPLCASLVSRFALRSFPEFPEVLGAILDQAHSDDHLVTARDALNHSEWFVRAKAAACLGRIGTQSDVARLERALSDKQWWVRHHAAVAIVDLLGAGDAVDDLLEHLDDRFARDILREALVSRREGV